MSLSDSTKPLARLKPTTKSSRLAGEIIITAWLSPL